MLFLSKTTVGTNIALISTLILPQTALAQEASTTSIAAPQSTIPPCAEVCLSNAKAAQDCADDACLCQRSSSIQTAIDSCLSASAACSSGDIATAVAFYPQHCASIGLTPNSVAASDSADGIVSASGQAPNQPIRTLGAPTVVVTATGAASPNNSRELSLPAILGITLATTLVALAVCAVMIYSYTRRRQMRNRRSRMDFFQEELGGPDPAHPIGRPLRCESVQSSFMVQPSPVEKDRDEFHGADLSRSSTLVSEPAPVARLDKDLPAIRASKYSTQHVEHAPTSTSATTPSSSSVVAAGSRDSARMSTLRKLLGDSGDRLRASFLSTGSKTSRAVSKSSSLAVDPREVQKDKEDEFDESNKI